jgi:hypothetical protein
MEEDDEDPETEYSEETKLKFYDYQAALRSDLILEEDSDDTNKL